MNTLAKVSVFSFVLFVSVSTPLHAQLQMLETENLRLIYLDGLHSFVAPHVARCFENSLAFHENHWQYELPEKVTVVLHDLMDHANGGAKNIPLDLILVAIAPFRYTFETMPANERMNTIMNHELVHIYAMDQTSGGDRFYRRVFWGKPVPIADNPLSILYGYLSTPRRSAPRWYHEGIAVFMETWMAGGYGRSLGAYDEMVFRTLVHDSARCYDPVGLEAEGSKVDFHVGVNSYLYGTRFFSYLAYTYGPEKLTAWVSRTTGGNAYFISQFKRVYGISLDAAWAGWLAWEREFQQANLQTIREYPTTSYTDLAEEAMGSISRAFYDPEERVLYTAVNYPGRIAHLAAIDIDEGTVSRLRDIKGPSLFSVSSLTFNPSSHSLFYTTDNFDWRDLVVFDTKTHDARELLKDARIGDLVFNPADTSLWGVRHFNGISTLVRIPYPYTEWKTVYPWPYGKDIYDIDISPDGTLLTGALAEVSGRQKLISMSTEALRSGDTSYTILYDFGTSNPESFVFSPDGRYLYGSSYYTGVSNIFRYDFQADSMLAMTNAETGFFHPIPYADDSLIVFRYTARGFVPSIIPAVPLEDVNAIQFLGQRVVDEHPVVKEWMVDPPSSINLDSLTVATGPYHAFRHLQLVSAYPIVEGYKKAAAYGLRLDFADLLSFHESYLTASYTPGSSIPSDERWHARWGYSHHGLGLDFAYNGADFYDLFGPTKTSRKGYSLGLQYDRKLVSDDPRTVELTIGATGYGGLERLPAYQNVTASYDKFLTASAQVQYKNLQASLGACDYEKGFSWKLLTDATYVIRTYYPHAVLTADYGIPLPLHHSSFWLRTATGYAHGDRDEPFANFYFGGFGNNWVDYRKEKRYREFYSFPGLELNEIGGTNFARATAEWALPPLRFRRLGFPALYCSWARVAVFASGLGLNFSERIVARQRAFNVGAQVDFRFQLLSHLRMTFSTGYAAAWKEDHRPSRELMVSLKVL